MVKKILKRNGALYGLALANLLYAATNGFNWLTVVSLGLAAAVLAWDILEEVQHGRK